ncbi:MAG: ABC transporter permease [Deltaproteobacteria bacterium]|nr:ABC transporter permease [Deltaproteobacteria bacterium]
MKNSTYTWSIRLVSLAVVLVVWEVYGRSVNPILFTYPTAVARAFVELVSKGELQRYLLQSIEVFLYGLGLAVVVGIPLGIFLARYATFSLAVEPYLYAIYSTPMVAFIPLIVLWFGFRVPAKVVIVFLFMVFPILLNTQQGVKNLSQDLLEVARSFCSSERRLWLDLIIPSSLPFILAGVNLAIGRGLVGMVVAEFFTSVAGLGYMIVQYANSFETAKLFVPIVVLMALGVTLIGLIKVIERKVTPWQNREQGEI